MKDLLEHFDVDNRESLLFASPNTVKALTVLNENMGQLVGEEIAFGKYDQATEAGIAQELSRAYLALAHDVREHLKLEKLKPGDIVP